MAEFIGIVLFIGLTVVFCIGWAHIPTGVSFKPSDFKKAPLTDAERVLVAVREMRTSRERLRALEMESMLAWEVACDCRAPETLTLDELLEVDAQRKHYGKRKRYDNVRQEWVPTGREGEFANRVKGVDAQRPTHKEGEHTRAELADTYFRAKGVDEELAKWEPVLRRARLAEIQLAAMKGKTLGVPSVPDGELEKYLSSIGVPGSDDTNRLRREDEDRWRTDPAVPYLYAGMSPEAETQIRRALRCRRGGPCQA